MKRTSLGPHLRFIGLLTKDSEAEEFHSKDVAPPRRFLLILDEYSENDKGSNRLALLRFILANSGDFLKFRHSDAENSYYTHYGKLVI